MKIGIIVAMDKEFKQLNTILSDTQTEHINHKDFVTGNLEDKEIILQQCGIGKVNSAIGAVEMINHYHPDLIISSGCAGGADTTLEVTDVVVATECAYHDAYCGDEVAFGQIIGMPARFKAPSGLIEKALSLNNLPDCKDLHIKAGLTVSGEWFVNSQEKMQQIINNFPDATAVDMESCSIAQVCHVYGTPFVSFRVISDIPLKDNKASQYFDFWERIANGSFEVTKHFISAI
ncbi:5'-methylthioadenosine/adenosylhomocysteine nucleosidase [Prevotella histicola]|jgi:MTA/SAH nucleosidase|uniref:5'-methylthioadenosine/adenosylhomocysteine nucleosidase n=1 Tax=Prevotella histicola TaxID=470565 RepID=UPI001C5DC01A|nr:5'-methylthioadenosine/adenosylhomocysteine nucleosidase [Prevotella histicola]MBS5897604.1 5'-methylthioadenosine/adenosylhomocysteine nucleosidase [Prevotella histicola]MBW4776053.1 5'-methylthioadenosine/adenosylhomocysteine nucleosidase [Prevotella histicola]